MTWLKIDASVIKTRFGRQYYSAIPVVPCVYVLYDRDESPIYVGQTTSLQARIRQHKPRKLSYIKYKLVECGAMRVYYERRLIKRLMPSHNRAGTGYYEPRGFRLVQWSRRAW